ncbi:MAG: DUF4922 domain-containing protein [Muribaculaceae bacterium]|nr:DUF4922 domain-containing protein [Muribaculaceae bacterium]
MINISMSLLDEMLREQLKVWPLATDNYAALGRTERRRFKIGALEGAFQYNPARIVSTGAKTDKQSIAQRRCFLCSDHRPDEQYSIPFTVDGGGEWEILVNPYPILPWHFTVASVNHEKQGEIPLDMIVLAEQLPGAVMFYNGARAGASAPDHLHFQMVLKEEMPLINYLESGGDVSQLPYRVWYRIVTPDNDGMVYLREFTEIRGTDRKSGSDDKDLVNAFAWMGDDGYLRLVVVPRSGHRPSCYDAGSGEGMLVSPGAIDVAGLIILPRRADYERINVSDLAKIYSETMIL